MNSAQKQIRQRLNPGQREILKRQGFCACYVLGLAECGPVKVGYASDIVTRVSQIQSAHWKPVTVFAVYWFAGLPLAQRVEAGALSALKGTGAHIRGEWFETSAKEAAKIVELSAIGQSIPWFTEEHRRAFADGVKDREINKLSQLFQK